MPDSFSFQKSPLGLGAPNDDPTPLCAQSHDAEAGGLALDFLFTQIVFPFLSQVTGFRLNQAYLALGQQLARNCAMCIAWQETI
jgi:hypothetical protein